MPRSSPSVRRAKRHMRVRTRSGRERPHAYRVYVIEAVDPRSSRVVLYVGQSGKTPEARLRDHESRDKTYCPRCRPRHYVPRAAGKRLRLRYDLFQHLPVTSSRVQAERSERKLAAQLRDLGFTVIGGH